MICAPELLPLFYARRLPLSDRRCPCQSFDRHMSYYFGSVVPIKPIRRRRTS